MTAVATAAPSRASARETVPALDGLRGVAIILVILWHCAARTQFPPDQLGLLRPVALAGWSGVDLFFALSGFLITRLLLAEERAHGAPGAIDLRRFYIRRGLRLLPAFYLVLLLNLLVFPLFPIFTSVPRQGLAPVEGLAVATYWSNYYYAYARVDPVPAVGIYWSLCVEEHFYVLWPFVLLLVRSPRHRLLAAAAACAVVPVLRWTGAEHSSVAAIHVLSHYRMDSILWGALGALLFEPAQRRPGARRIVLGALVVTVAGGFASAHMGVSPSRIGQAFGLSALAALGTALTVEVAAARTLLARALEVAPLRGLGRVSYGAYLLHFQVIDLTALAITRAMPYASPSAFMALAGTSVAAVFAVAAVMFVLYERRFLALKERFTPPRASLTSVGMVFFMVGGVLAPKD